MKKKTLVLSAKVIFLSLSLKIDVETLFRLIGYIFQLFRL